MDNFESFEIAMLIKEIYSKITNTISKSLKDSGLTYQQIMVIKIIAHKKVVTISDLCTELSLAKGTVSGIITRLEKLGYIKKIKSLEDKRNTYVKFSDKGLEFAIKFRQDINNTFDKIFKDFNKEDLSNLKILLLDMRKKLTI
ncbi:MAG: MarR family transcriptional regulator [Clostridium perfringens]|nr:MarR family transcriptional regulator [Clostridium perfringens]